MKKWKCLICKYIHNGEAPPEKCPICKAPAEKFVEVAPEVSPGGKETAKDAAAATGGGQSDAAAALPADRGFIVRLLNRHHAHPILVHFPNGVLPVALAMFLLAILFNAGSLATAGFYNIIFVMLALPLVIYTGFLAWDDKYKKALTSAFQIKILAAAVTFTACLIAVVWCLIDPGVIGSAQGWLFLIINVIALIGAGIAGHIGGKLVFKE